MLVAHWEFKDVGLPPDKMKMLVNEMRVAGKITYLEAVDSICAYLCPFRNFLNVKQIDLAPVRTLQSLSNRS